MPRRVGNQQLYFEFALWAISLGRPPSVKEVEGFFQVGRESAWRIHRKWMRAHSNHLNQPAANGSTCNKETK